jgi:hypothetical protein
LAYYTVAGIYDEELELYFDKKLVALNSACI